MTTKDQSKRMEERYSFQNWCHKGPKQENGRKIFFSELVPELEVHIDTNLIPFKISDLKGSRWEEDNKEQ
jgi:hypothetical protein